jgi:hypothetical protein
VAWGVRGELDGWAETPEDVGQYARRWFDAAAQGLTAGLLEDLRAGPPQSRKVFGSGASPEPWGEPGGLFASLLRFDRLWGDARSKRVWSDRAWKQFLDGLSDLPVAGELRIFELNERGKPSWNTVTVSAQRVSEDGRWFRLFCQFLCSDPRPETRVAELTTQDVVDVVREAAEEIPATFGCVTDDGGAGGETALEFALNAAWDDGIKRSREVLRGYPWVTICAPRIVERLGGVDAVQASGAFHELRVLRTGSIWLQATERLEDHAGEALQRLFRTLAPVLPAGEPKPYVGEYLGRMVYQDASTVSGP